MKGVVVAIIFSYFVCAAVCTFTEEQYQTTFVNWMKTHQKSYSTQEFQPRYVTFKNNVDFVAAWDPVATGFEVELNKFADMSIEEFSRVYLGTRFEPNAVLGHTTHAPPTDDSVDWRTKGFVTDIKNQGDCGSCWSFSTTGSTEGQYFNSSKNLVSFSEQQLVDCSDAFGNQGCNGGLMNDAFRYIMANGIVSEASYPYTAQDGTCNLAGKTVVTKLSTYHSIKSKDETALAGAINTVGPVSVAIDASHSSFQLYKNGVYYEHSCSQTSLDHGVLAVGFGTDSGSDFYIVKNSWGTSWGMEGYINMSRNKKNNCGIATMASYPLV